MLNEIITSIESTMTSLGYKEENSNIFSNSDLASGTSYYLSFDEEIDYIHLGVNNESVVTFPVTINLALRKSRTSRLTNIKLAITKIETIIETFLLCSNWPEGYKTLCKTSIDEEGDFIEMKITVLVEAIVKIT